MAWYKTLMGYNIFWLEQQSDMFDSFMASKCLNKKLEIVLCRACGYPDCECRACSVLCKCSRKTKAKKGTTIRHTRLYIYIYIYIFMKIYTYCVHFLVYTWCVVSCQVINALWSMLLATAASRLGMDTTMQSSLRTCVLHGSQLVSTTHLCFTR